MINLGVMLDIAIKKPDSTYGDIVRLEGTGPLSLRVNDCVPQTVGAHEPTLRSER